MRSAACWPGLVVTGGLRGGATRTAAVPTAAAAAGASAMDRVEPEPVLARSRPAAAESVEPVIEEPVVEDRPPLEEPRLEPDPPMEPD
jgi:hypothetical protein